MMTYDIIVQVSGREHSGKTSLIALIDELLKQRGIDVVVQRIDEQFDEKVVNIDETIERVKRSKIIIMEHQTAPTKK